jgi:signal transduction histidine kinase
MSLQSRVPIPHLGRALRIYSLLAVALVVLTLLLDRLEGYFGLALLMPYLVLVALAARWGGLGAAIFTSLASVPLVDYFLFEPVGHLELASRPMIQFLLVLLAGLLLGWLIDNLRAARERAEAATEAERAALQERDALLSIIAHDLRSPLTALKARIQLAELSLQRQEPDRSAALRSLQTALPQVDRINRLLDDLLATGRTDGGTLAVEPTEMDLAPLVARVAERWLAAAPDHPLELELEEPLPVLGDGDRLEQVLDNLLANAVKYSPPGSPVRLSARAQDSQVRLAVTDRGGGIPPDEQAHLFERFYRRPEHRTGRQIGLGLGLYITRGLVAAHGGSISVDSEVGRGSTFVVTLPRRADAAGLQKTA